MSDIKKKILARKQQQSGARESAIDRARKNAISKSNPTSGASAPSWAHRGYDGVEQRLEEQRKRRESFVPEFYLTDGMEAEILFIDEVPVTGDFHSVPRAGGKGYDTETCLLMAGNPTCPFCEKYKFPSFKGNYTVFDLRKVHVFKDRKSGTERRRMCRSHFVDAKGRPERCEDCENGLKTEYAGIKIYRASLTEVSKLKKMSKRVGLTNKKWFVECSGVKKAKSLNWTPEDLSPKDKKIISESEPLDFGKLLEPRSVADAKRICGAAGTFGGGGRGSSVRDDEDVVDVEE